MNQYRGDENLTNAEIEEMESADWDAFLEMSYTDPAELSY